MDGASKIPSSIFEFSSGEDEAAARLPGIIQWWLTIFAFFLAFPAIDVAGLSITFYLFFIILIIHARHRVSIITRDKTNKWFILLFVAGTIGTLSHPHFAREVSFLSDFKTIAQYAYWILLAMYIRSNYRLIDWWKIARALVWGLCALVVGYYFLPINGDLAFFNIHSGISRNGFVYNLLAFFPLTVIYLKNLRPRFLRVSLFALFVLSVLLSNGRAGFILIILETLLVGMILYPGLTRTIKVGLLFVLIVFVFWQINSESILITKISSAIEHVNPRASAMLNKEGTEGDLTLDKSWLLRRLMLDKSMEIVAKYPVFGIGWMHFINYDAQLNTLKKYPRLQYLDKTYLNTRSSHNSYAMYLAEGGIAGFIFLIVILLTTIWPFLRKFLKNNLSITDASLVALAILVIYFYVITSITGANTWFIVGAALGCVRNSIVPNVT